jgi:uncharacterized integral membrane protein
MIIVYAILAMVGAAIAGGVLWYELGRADQIKERRRIDRLAREERSH